jgi:predicted CXXCH cytochrome family protein
MRRRLLTLGLLVLLAAAALTGAPRAAELSAVPLPEITKGKGESCVAETGFMRRNHMDLLSHQRDQTLRQGIRGARFSLKECVACHAVPGSDGTPVTADDPRFFCTACHEYAAVRIDCFECHASRPQAAGGVAGARGASDALSMVGKDWK